MNLASLTNEDKVRVKQIFLYGVSQGRNGKTDTEALINLGQTLQTNFLGNKCEECGSELVTEQTSQDIDGNRGEITVICPSCDR